MGLLQDGSSGINAKLCYQSTPHISTSHPKARLICTPSMDVPKLWCNKATHNPLGYFTANPREMKRRIQKNIRTFLYYACAVGCIMLPALNTLAEQQSIPTKNTEATITHLLEYTATNPSAVIQYKSSDMILHIDSDASYLSDPRACSRTGGHYYLNLLPTDPKKDPNLPPPENGPIHT